MATIKFPPREEWDKADDAYCLAVGQVSVLWAKIHEDLAQFYIYRLGTNSQQAEIAWYSHRTDSGQRDLLKKTVQEVPIANADGFPAAKEDLLWSIEHINLLSKIRNDAIHAAVFLIWSETGPTFSPGWWSRDPRSKKLQGVDLLKGLVSCRKDLQSLLEFNRLMNSCLFAPDATTFDWPSRPTLISSS